MLGLVLVLIAAFSSSSPAGARGWHGPKKGVRQTASSMSQKNRAAAQAVSHRVARKMLSSIKKLSTIEGSGFERYGQGDARIIKRRNLVMQVMEHDAALFSSLKRKPGRGRGKRAVRRTSTKLPDWLTRDIDALGRVERTDAMKNPGDKSGFATLNEVWTRVDGAARINDKRASQFLQGLMNGKETYFKVDQGRCSTSILGQIKNPNLRARTMVDMLLQFRDAESRSSKNEEMRVGGTGVQAVMELRQNARWITNRRGKTNERDYALMRALVTSNPRTSSNAVLEARNIMGELRRHSWQLVYGDKANQPGFRTSPYEAIHRNFSTQTSQVIKAFVGQTVFGGGNPETFCGLVDAMNAGRSGKQAEAQRLLSAALSSDAAIAAKLRRFQQTGGVSRKPLPDQIEQFLVSRCKGTLDSVNYNAVKGTLVGDQAMHLEKAGVQQSRGNHGKKLSLVSQVYRAVVNSTPTARTLGDLLFSAKGAHLSVANVIAHMERGASRQTTQAAIAHARVALRKEFGKQKKGYVRLGIWQLDRKLDMLHAKLLGSTVDSIGTCKTRGQRGEAVVALRAALLGTLASGLCQIRDFKDPHTRMGPAIKKVVKELGKLEVQLGKGGVSLKKYQEVMSRANEAIVRVSENIQSYLDSRIPHVEQGKLVPNPEFFDNFIKDSPLHYAAAIAQKGSSVGLTSRMSRTQMVNPKNVTALNRMGRVVFDRVLVANSLEELAQRGATKNDFGMVRAQRGAPDEKKMVTMGGIMANFPGGFSHAANFSRGAGMAALANPSVGAQWEAFARNIGKDKLYYDDRGGRLVMMPLRQAIKKGLVKGSEVKKLRPGNNRRIKYYSWNENKRRWAVSGEHVVKVNAERRTNTVKIYTAARRVKGVDSSVMSFEKIGRMGTDARGLVGEKGLVLGLLSVHNRLGKRTPPGAVITAPGVQRLLDAAGALKPWLAVWDKDPRVKKVTDRNFLKSKFYSDPRYREETRQKMTRLVGDRLRAHLLTKDGEPTKAGRAVLADIINSNPKLRTNKIWIVRSGFTTEDRPFKSSAGQYDSFPALRTSKQKLEGIIGVILSAWNKQAIENTVAEQYNLRHVWPTIPVMKSVDALKSGVFVTRDSETGYRRTLSYQAVKGFGGGVEGGVTEEGRVNRHGLQVSRGLPGAAKSLLSSRMARDLFRAGMMVESLFNRVVEPGRGFPIDVEWVVDKSDRKLYLVQARTVPIR